MGKATVIKCDAIWHTRLDSSAIKDNKGRKFLKRIDEDPSTHLGKIIIKDVDELRKIVNGTRKLNEINNFNKHTKAYLYDIIGGSLSIEDAAGRVLLPGKYGPEAEFKPIEERNHEEEFGHDYDYWTRECEIGSREDCLDEWATECENDNVNACLEVRLASETLANISAVAVVNSEAFNAIKKYLPESYEMFVEILEDMIDRVL